MARAREIIDRRKAVRNIRKITKVMQMIATARYQKAFRRAVATKPYVQKIGEMVADVARSASGDARDLPLLRSPENPKRTAVLVVTSNRGLAGGYNGSILRVAQHLIRDLESSGQAVELHVAGKKGVAYFRFAKRAMAGAYTQIADAPAYADIEPIADTFIRQFISGEIDALKIVYMKFLSAGQQRVHTLDVLPLSALLREESPEPKATGGMTAVYEFAPSARELLADLLPSSIKVAIFQTFMDAAVSEQIARMVAMKAATDNAETMSKYLTRQYNRARQSQITSELSELMGGVEALK